MTPARVNQLTIYVALNHSVSLSPRLPVSSSPCLLVSLSPCLPVSLSGLSAPHRPAHLDLPINMLHQLVDGSPLLTVGQECEGLPGDTAQLLVLALQVVGRLIHSGPVDLAARQMANLAANVRQLLAQLRLRLRIQGTRLPAMLPARSATRGSPGWRCMTPLIPPRRRSTSSTLRSSPASSS